MAKRRAEDAQLPDSPSKRCRRSLCSVDMQLGSVAPPAGGVSPPSLLALLGSRCRKRPYYFEEPEEQEDTAVYRRASHWDARKPAAGVFTLQTSGSFQERRACCKKRAREERTSSEAAADRADEKASEDSNTEDSVYNSFQFWRPPLPELDLSLLEEYPSQTKDKSKLKDSSSVAMET